MFKRAEVLRQRFHPEPEDSGTLSTSARRNLFSGTRDEDRNSVGKSNYDGAGNEFHPGTDSRTPMITSRTPAITVYTYRPSTPWTATIPATTTTNAPVDHRSGNLIRREPRSGIR